MPLSFHPAEEIPEVVVVEPRVHEDARGFFMETVRASEFHAAGLPTAFVQEAHSRNVGKHILRGLHFQDAPAQQGKLVRCVRGACYDVVVDIRRSSPTYGRHVALTLDAESKRAVWVPEGFAHGYLTMSDECEILYLFTGNEFSAPHYRTLRWDDPALAIPWPTSAPQLSAKDAGAPGLAELDHRF